MSEQPPFIIPSIFLVKAHLYGSDVQDIEWISPTNCSVRTTSGHEFSIDNDLFMKILTKTIEDVAIAEKDETWGPWGWQNKPETISKQAADFSEILFNLSKLKGIPEEARTQLTEAALLCSEASYTVVGEDPAKDGLLTEVRVAMEEKNGSSV